MPYIRVILALCASVAIISSASILIKLAAAPVLIIAAYRLGIAALVLAPVTLAVRREHLKALSKRDWLIGVVAGSFLGLHFIAWIASLEYTSVASSVVLVTINPIFVGLGMVVIFRERLHPLLVWGIALSVTGGILIGYSDFQVEGQALFGDMLALLGAVFHSGYLLLGQRLRQRLDLLPYITVVYGMAALLVLITALVTQQPFTGYAPATYLVMLLAGAGTATPGPYRLQLDAALRFRGCRSRGHPRRARGREHTGVLHLGRASHAAAGWGWRAGPARHLSGLADAKA